MISDYLVKITRCPIPPQFKQTTNLWIHIIFGWITFVSFQIHPDGGATTSSSTEAENNAGVIRKDQADTLWWKTWRTWNKINGRNNYFIEFNTFLHVWLKAGWLMKSQLHLWIHKWQIVHDNVQIFIFMYFYYDWYWII